MVTIQHVLKVLEDQFWKVVAQGGAAVAEYSWAGDLHSS